MQDKVFGTVLDIWMPKFTTNEVLIATHKVSKNPGNTYITFTKYPSLKGRVYMGDNDIIRSYPTKQNGKGTVYVVPMEELMEVGILQVVDEDKER